MYFDDVLVTLRSFNSKSNRKLKVYRKSFDENTYLENINNVLYIHKGNEKTEYSVTNEDLFANDWTYSIVKF